MYLKKNEEQNERTICILEEKLRLSEKDFKAKN